jgi:hypothetical protein
MPWPYPILFGSVANAKAMYGQVHDASAMPGKRLNPAAPGAAGDGQPKAALARILL